jgi:hypothetical protein
MPLWGKQQKIRSLRQMNFQKLVKIGLCAAVLFTIFVNVGAASVSSEISRYQHANDKQLVQMENSFRSQYQHFAGQKNIIVISDSANFETFNCVRHYKVLPGAKLRLTDYKGRTETVSVKTIQNKYECYVMAKAPRTFDTSGSLSANFYAMRD